MSDLEALLNEAFRLPVEGWTFEAIRGRWQTRRPPWDLAQRSVELLRPGSSLLDLGTGGGEFLRDLLASVRFRPSPIYATEGYAPNLTVARSRLRPLGVRVLPIARDQRILLPDGSVDLVMDRHEAFDAREVRRVLRPGGRFVTQQVGARNYAELHERFGVSPAPAVNRVESVDSLAVEVEAAGLRVRDRREATYPERFLDVGAVVYFLRRAPWEVPGFSVERDRPTLEALHAEVERNGSFELMAHRLFVEAERPSER